MLNAQRRYRSGLTESSGFFLTRVGSRLRAFGLLALLVPLFAGLQFLAIESTPRVEVRVVTQAPTADEPAQAPAERIVERVVYVSVAKSETAQLSDTSSVSPVAEQRAEASVGPMVGGLDSAGTPRIEVARGRNRRRAGSTRACQRRCSVRCADSAYGPARRGDARAAPAPVAAMAAAPVVRAVAPQRVIEPVDDDAVAEDDTPDEGNSEGEAVADEPADSDGDQQEVAEIQVIDTTIEADQSTRVISYKIPVRSVAAAGPPEGVDAPSADQPRYEADVPGETPAGDGDAANVADARARTKTSPTPRTPTTMVPKARKQRSSKVIRMRLTRLRPLRRIFLTRSRLLRRTRMRPPSRRPMRW